MDVFKESDLNVATGLPIAAPDEFGLDGFEEGFDGGIEVPLFVERAVRAIFACSARWKFRGRCIAFYSAQFIGGSFSLPWAVPQIALFSYGRAYA